MNDPIVELFAARGVFLDPEAVLHVRQQTDPTAYAEQVLGAFLEPPFHLTLGQLLEAESVFGPQPQRALALEFAPTRLPEARSPVPLVAPPAGALAADYASEVEVLRDATHQVAPRGDPKDFLEYFNDRLRTLTRLLKRRREVANAVPMNRAFHAGKEVQLIGMVTETSKAAKTGHRFLELEDVSGTATVLAHASRPELVALADTLLDDEVIGVVAKPSKDGSLLIADQIVRPDLPFQPDRLRTEVPLYAAFLGDIHMGSKSFLRTEFRRMMRWLHAKEGPQRESAIASRVKYLVLPGDIVDGVGVYPGQEANLEIPDVLAQYQALARELEALPRHVSLIVIPGNHDATRPSEPQPALAPEIRSYFDRFDATFVSNPSAFSLHGVSVFAYHGYSMVDFATTVPGQSLDRPIDIMKQMLQCRHVAPTYGGKTPISPEARDLLIIDPIPDIFVTGHVHVAALDRYRGVTLVNGGSWQSQTSYQKMHNLIPTPAVMPIVNLSTLTGTKIDFSAPS